VGIHTTDHDDEGALLCPPLALDTGQQALVLLLLCKRYLLDLERDLPFHLALEA